MKILVTGSEGNIGKVLVKYLESCGHEVFGIDIVHGYGERFRTCDINTPSDMEPVFNRFEPDKVIHLAGIVSRIVCERSPSLTIQTNVSGTYNIIRLCKKVNAKLIFFSTSEVYGDANVSVMHESEGCHPKNIYGLSKFLAEQLINYEITNGLSAITVRPFMIYHENEKKGENHSCMIRFAEALTKRKKITIHKGSVRSWLHVDDVVDIIERLLHIEGDHTLNIGNPNDSIKIESLAKMMCDHLNICLDDYVKYEVIPDRMTLIKIPVLHLQYSLTKKSNFIALNDGVKRVLKNAL